MLPFNQQTDAIHPAVPAAGRIDVHSHILPGIDDGSDTHEDVLTSVRRLQSLGYVGSICTPHVYPEVYPDNIVPHIGRWVEQLQRTLAQAGMDYALWQGGELRLYPGVIDWLEQHEVPTLAGSRCVLVECWTKQWEDWIDEGVDWLLDRGYQVIFAHPERVKVRTVPTHMARLRKRGVLLQGNTRCLAGGEGEQAQQFAHQFLTDGWYDMLALDMHRPNTLESRISGIDVACEIVGEQHVDELLVHAPRRIIFEQSQ